MMVFDHIWQSSLVALAVYVLTLLFRNNSAAIRYWLWFAASVKFLLPFAALAALGRMAFTHTVPAGAMAVLTEMRPVAMPFSVLAAPAVEPFPWQSLMLAIWALGMASVGIVWLAHGRRLSAVAQAAQTLAFDLPIPVKSADCVLEPGLVGIRRPVILLPEGIVNRLSGAQMDAVLAHELCHLRRRDNLLAAVHMLVECLFWFHPLVWFIGARLVDEREQACDEEVMAGGKNPLEYAETILTVCRLYLRSPLACAAGISGADLDRRITAIMARHDVLEMDAGRKALLAGLLAITLAAPLAAGSLSFAPVAQLAQGLAKVLVPLAPKSQPAVTEPVVPARPPARGTIRYRQGQPAAAPAIAIPETVLRPPAIQVSTPVIVIPDLQLEMEMQSAGGASEANVCRAPQQLPGSRLMGPQVCMPSRAWDRIKEQKLMLMPDGRTLAASLEQGDAMKARPCYTAGSAASSVTTWPINCF